MAWIEAHQELRDHPKTKRAARLLGISRPQMIGHLLCLWWWCLDYAEDGNLSDFDAEDIADAAEWEGDADEFVAALINCGPADRPGFIIGDGDSLSIRDWSQYGGKYITKRNQGRDRQRAWRERNAGVTQGNAGNGNSNADVTRYNDVTSSVTNTPREDKSREDKIDDGGLAAAKQSLQVLGLWTKEYSDRFNDLWPELAGRQGWIGQAITVTRDASPRAALPYALKVLANSIHTNTPPGYEPPTKEPRTNGRGGVTMDEIDKLMQEALNGKS